MPKPKVYIADRQSLNNPRISAIFGDTWRADYSVWVVAFSKAEASAMATERLTRMEDKEWRVASGSAQHEALREAGLLNEPGTILITTNRGGENPVVMVKQESQLVEPDEPPVGAIGMFKNRGTGVAPAYDFLPVEARFGRKGSVAVGRDIVMLKDREDRWLAVGSWSGTNGLSYTDAEVQHLLDMREVEITRAGYGAWRNGAL